MIPRRTITELRLRYKLEPELCDVFVEGIFDKDVLTEAFVLDDQTNRAIYEINTVDVPARLLEELGLTSGNKQRIIALATEMSNLDAKCQVKFLIDKDYDDFVSDGIKTDRLVTTKHTCQESYFFNKTIINTILLKIAKCKNTNIDDVYVDFAQVLGQLFAFQLAAKDIDSSLQWPSFFKSMDIKETRVVFDENKYCEHLLSLNSCHKIKTKLIEKYRERLKEIQTLDTKDTMRGHDFTEILAWKIAKTSNLKNLNDTKIIQRLFVANTADAIDVLHNL